MLGPGNDNRSRFTFSGVTHMVISHFLGGVQLCITHKNRTVYKRLECMHLNYPKVELLFDRKINDEVDNPYDCFKQIMTRIFN